MATITFGMCPSCGRMRRIQLCRFKWARWSTRSAFAVGGAALSGATSGESVRQGESWSKRRMSMSRRIEAAGSVSM